MKTETKEKKTELTLDVQLLKEASLVIRAFNHNLRQQMLTLIHQKGRIMVTDIYVKLRLEQSVASQHLAILRKPGMVTAQREGKKIFYAVNYNRLAQVNALMETLLKK